MIATMLEEISPNHYRLRETGCLLTGAVVFDLAARTVRRTWVAGLPFAGRCRALGEFDAVVLTYQPGDEGEGTYTVRLHGRPGRRDYTVAVIGRYTPAVAAASTAAFRLGLRLEDQAPPSLAAKARRAAAGPFMGEEAVAAAAPRVPLSRIACEGRTLRIDLPPRPMVRAILRELGAALVLGGLILIYARRKRGCLPCPPIAGEPLWLWALAAFAVLSLPRVFTLLKRGRTPTAITVTPDTLMLVGPELPMRKRELQAADLLDVVVAAPDLADPRTRPADGRAPLPPGCAGGALLNLLLAVAKALAPRGLVFVTRDGRINVGGHLPTDELLWLRDQVRRALAASAANIPPGDPAP
jgi:hypothetical protein